MDAPDGTSSSDLELPTDLKRRPEPKGHGFWQVSTQNLAEIPEGSFNGKIKTMSNSVREGIKRYADFESM